MDRITQKDLEYLTDRINEATNSPLATCTKRIKADCIAFTWNIGNYHLDYACNGVKLVRLCNNKGAIRTISTGGNGTKRELYHWMQAFLAGISQGKA